MDMDKKEREREGGFPTPKKLYCGNDNNNSKRTYKFWEFVSSPPPTQKIKQKERNIDNLQASQLSDFKVLGMVLPNVEDTIIGTVYLMNIVLAVSVIIQISIAASGHCNGSPLAGVSSSVRYVSHSPLKTQTLFSVSTINPIL